MDQPQPQPQDLILLPPSIRDTLAALQLSAQRAREAMDLILRTAVAMSGGDGPGIEWDLSQDCGTLARRKAPGGEK